MLKTKEVTITRSGRDFSKRFLLTEMPAERAEKWAIRALSAMSRSGVDIPPHVLEMGMMGVVVMGFRAVLMADFKDAEPLLDEMMSCIQSVQPAATRAMIPEDIEEVQTRMFLRSEVFELHTGFSVAAFLSRVWEEAAAKREASRNTQTSQETSGSSLPVA